MFYILIYLFRPTGVEGKAHLRDSMVPPPQTLKPEFERKEITMEDVSNFPQTEMVPLPESFSYQEGKYRPPSLPLHAGYYPIHIYLYRGKKYDWCSCGHSWNNPFCNGQCKWILTRCRPIQFNVAESGYYKLCNCKMSSNAPFCNSTHKLVYKWILKSNKGFFHWTGFAGFLLAYAYWGLIWYQ